MLFHYFSESSEISNMALIGNIPENGEVMLDQYVPMNSKGPQVVKKESHDSTQCAGMSRERTDIPNNTHDVMLDHYATISSKDVWAIRSETSPASKKDKSNIHQCHIKTKEACDEYYDGHSDDENAHRSHEEYSSYMEHSYMRWTHQMEQTEESIHSDSESSSQPKQIVGLQQDPDEEEIYREHRPVYSQYSPVEMPVLSGIASGMNRLYWQAWLSRVNHPLPSRLASIGYPWPNLPVRSYGDPANFPLQLPCQNNISSPVEKSWDSCQTTHSSPHKSRQQPLMPSPKCQVSSPNMTNMKKSNIKHNRSISMDNISRSTAMNNARKVLTYSGLPNSATLQSDLQKAFALSCFKPISDDMFNNSSSPNLNTSASDSGLYAKHDKVTDRMGNEKLNEMSKISCDRVCSSKRENDRKPLKSVKGEKNHKSKHLRSKSENIKRGNTDQDQDKSSNNPEEKMSNKAPAARAKSILNPGLNQRQLHKDLDKYPEKDTAIDGKEKKLRNRPRHKNDSMTLLNDTTPKTLKGKDGVSPKKEVANAQTKGQDLTPNKKSPVSSEGQNMNPNKKSTVPATGQGMTPKKCSTPLKGRPKEKVPLSLGRVMTHVVSNYNDYLKLSDEDMHQYECENARDFSYNDDAYAVIQDRGLYVWQLIDNLRTQLC